MKLLKVADRSLAALVGVIIGAVLVLSVDAFTRQPETESPRVSTERVPSPSIDPTPVDLPKPPSRTAVLAWSPGGLPAGAESAVERARSVVAATTVVGGQDWIVETRSSDGSVVDRPGDGYRIPVDVAAVEPRRYARFVPAGDRDLIHALGPGRVLLARTAAELREAEPGMAITLSDRTVRVAGVVSDVAANGYEILMAKPAPSSWNAKYRFLLAEVKGRRYAAVEERLAPLLEPGRRLRVRSGRETPFLRYGDAVLPMMALKKTFGEFAARPRADGGIDVDPSWVRHNIERASVPILGSVICHRVIVPQLRAALREVEERGLGFTIDPADYGGCYSPRFINADPQARLSHHAWGIAVDINVSENAFGTRPDIDPRLVDALTEWGFTWGGGWLLPDGMHFEWVAFP